jgi:hypothetical protein
MSALGLTDEQYDALINALRPLQTVERQQLLGALNVMFEGRCDVGDGELGRALRTLQREYFRPPLRTPEQTAPRHQQRRAG